MTKDKPITEEDKQVQPMAGELDPETSFCRINVIASLVVTKQLKEDAQKLLNETVEK